MPLTVGEFISCAGYGEDAKIEAAVEAGHDPNEGDDVGLTALKVACKNGHLTTVKLLLKLGAKPDVCPGGHTPLMGASRGGYIDIVTALLEAGATADLADAEGQTPLMGACAIGNELVAKLLVSHGANLQYADEAGRTPLIHAIAPGHTNIVKWLLTSGADPSVVTDDAKIPIEIAKQWSQDEIVELLKEFDAALNVVASKPAPRAPLPAAFASPEPSSPRAKDSTFMTSGDFPESKGKE